ncbi:hypothetical protein GCM10022245_42660 [Streptomyces mayteni]
MPRAPRAVNRARDKVLTSFRLMVAGTGPLRGAFAGPPAGRRLAAPARGGLGAVVPAALSRVRRLGAPVLAVCLRRWAGARAPGGAVPGLVAGGAWCVSCACGA